jgi:hypothetical protein
MFESKNVKTVRKIAIIDRVWEARYQVTAHGLLDDSPTSGRLKDPRNRPIRFNKELNSQCRDTVFVISRCLD